MPDLLFFLFAAEHDRRAVTTDISLRRLRQELFGSESVKKRGCVILGFVTRFGSARRFALPIAAVSGTGGANPAKRRASRPW